MQYVSDKWYNGYTRAVTALSIVFLIISTLDALGIEPVSSLTVGWGMSVITMSLAAIHLIYSLGLYRFINNRNGIYAAALIGNFIFMINVVNLIHSTGRLHSWYHIIWAAIVFLAGIFGPYMIIAFCFLTLLYMVLVVTDIPGQIVVDPFSMVSATAIFIIGTVSYLFWRGKYIDAENKKIAQLSGQLKSNRLQSEILLNSIGDGIILIGTDGKINLINPAAAKMTEWPVEEAIGISAATVINLLSEDGKDIPAGNNPISQVLSKQKPSNQILQLVGRNQKALTVSIVASPVIIPSSKQFAGAVAVIRDVSNTRAEEKRRADFISTASHEMRTPVAAIEGYLALALNDHVSQIDIKARGYLEKAHASTQSLGKLFQDLLTSAKAEDGRLVSNPIVVELGEFLEQLGDGLRFAAQKKGLLVDFKLGAENGNQLLGGSRVVKPLYHSLVDPERLREAVTNLFDNAVKYTESGKITIGLTGNNEIVQLSITDTGAGIPKEDIPHLFQKFYRVDNSATRLIGGTGLGLYICRKIIELYKGKIWVTSELGKGSTFYINLPRLSAQQASQMQNAQPPKPSTLPVTNSSSAPSNAPTKPVISTTP